MTAGYPREIADEQPSRMLVRACQGPGTLYKYDNNEPQNNLQLGNITLNLQVTAVRLRKMDSLTSHSTPKGGIKNTNMTLTP